MIIDSHCHLDFPDFNDDRDAIIARARAAGIGGMVSICTKFADFPAILDIANTHDGIWCSVGVHPREAEGAKGLTAENIMAETDHAKVIAIGEAGLDFYYEHSPRPEQEQVFRAHIEAARQTGLPIIIHTRDADDETVQIISEEQERGAFPGLIHCFSANRAVAETALRYGMYISFSGIVTFKNAENVRDVAKIVPHDRLLVETDAPYLSPVPVRGKRCEPAFTAHTAAFLGDFLGLSQKEIADVTTDNFFRLFPKADRADIAV